MEHTDEQNKEPKQQKSLIEDIEHIPERLNTLEHMISEYLPSEEVAKARREFAKSLGIEE